MRRFSDIGRIMVFIKDSNKKGFLQITKEIFVLMVVKREFPFYYFKYIYRKDVTNYLDHLSLNEQRLLQSHKSLHNPEYVTLIDNKLYFSLLSERSSVETPKLLSFNFKSSFFYDNNVVQIDNKEDLIIFFKRIFDAADVDAIFFRPPSDYGGKGCFKITKEYLKDKIDNTFDTLKAGNYVHTEVIKQHPMINRIHSNSINTLRIVSLITSENEIEIVSAFIRFGIGESVVDNASSGGFFVGINLDDGTLKSFGHFLPEYGGAKISEHPDSGFKLEGFKIPFYKEACESVFRATKAIPDRLIGWDVAITPDGPVIIESNSHPHMQMSNIAYGGLLKNPHIKKLVGELKMMN